MARVKIELPATFPFSTLIPIRITDINYGNHVGNDSILSLIHEIRIQYLRHYGMDEMNFGGVGLVMSDAAIEFKSELFYGDAVKAYASAANFSRVAFDVYYKLVREKDESVVVLAKTGMVGFDFSKRKIASLPNKAVEKISNHQSAISK